MGQFNGLWAQCLPIKEDDGQVASEDLRQNPGVSQLSCYPNAHLIEFPADTSANLERLLEVFLLELIVVPPSLLLDPSFAQGNALRVILGAEIRICCRNTGMCCLQPERMIPAGLGRIGALVSLPLPFHLGIVEQADCRAAQIIIVIQYEEGQSIDILNYRGIPATDHPGEALEDIGLELVHMTLTNRSGA